jgi:hemerythrin-like metal-binding protein
METIEWSTALWLDFEPLDSLNRELMARLARAQAASDTELATAWSELVAHVAGHFGQEDTWMRETGHGRAEAHALEHRVVLNLLREGVGQIRMGELGPVRQMAQELGAWFSRHTHTFDAALALHLRRHVLT